MKRSNTIDDCYNDTWPICQYYYTHNTGSCDDILLYGKETIGRQELKKRSTSPINKKKRSYSYPITLSDQQAYPKQLVYDNNNGSSSSNKQQQHIVRRWTTVHDEKKKRQTLANIISSISSAKASASTNKVQITTDNNLESKWESIRQYHNGMIHNGNDEKIEEEDIVAVTNNQQENNNNNTYTSIEAAAAKEEEEEEEEETSDTMLAGGTATSTTLTDSGINVNSSLIAIPPASSRRVNRNDDHSISINTPPEDNVDAEAEPKNDSSNEKNGYRRASVDMILFLFGFLFFPLWWIGAWNYIMQQQNNSLPSAKQRQVFQILNCCMSLASLLLIGLIIGLTTAWA